MNLAELLSAPLPSLDVLRGLWLAFPSQLGEALSSAQTEQHTIKVQPANLTDGRLALCADALSEIGDGGVFSLTFSHLDSSKFDYVEVIDNETFQSLLTDE